ncbi:MAG: NFACT RNA binding domain-containing protein [Polyangiales bacterium]
MKLKVERVDQPEPGLLCFTVRADRRNRALLISLLPGALGVGLLDERPRGNTATEPVSQLRRHLAGATIERVEMSNRFVRITSSRLGSNSTLICAPRKPAGSWWLLGAEDTITVRSSGARAVTLDEEGFLRALTVEQLEAGGSHVHAAHAAASSARNARVIDHAVKRLRKKRAAIEGDLERARQADRLHEQATLILAYASEIAANSGYFDATTWADPPELIRIALDPSKTAPQNAEALFRKSKRLKRGLEVAPGRLGKVDAQLGQLAELRQRASETSIDQIANALSKLGIGSAAARDVGSKRRRPGARRPYREFVTNDDSAIFVGRSATDNDRLTLRVARPHDLWLHARGVTGAHVVVPLGKGKSCEPGALVDAATLAAHFSDLRGEAIVDVLYTPRRFVHKRRGSAVGSVSLEREKVISVRVEEGRLARLLASERKP